MSSEVCYLVGMKCGHKKNGGDFYGCLRFLLPDKWGDYQIEKVWIDNEEQYKSLVSAVTVGMSVVLTVTISGNLVSLSPNPEYPDLLLA